MKSRKNKTIVLGALFVSAIVFGSLAYSHCQIPCGIYDDEARFNSIAEHITTIEKSMKQIEELKRDSNNLNQSTRWVMNKEAHADKLSEEITYYSMAQRITPVGADGDKSEREKYVREITTLHEMLVFTMKCKQTTDLGNVEKVKSLLKDFESSYMGSHEQH